MKKNTTNHFKDWRWWSLIAMFSVVYGIISVQFGLPSWLCNAVAITYGFFSGDIIDWYDAYTCCLGKLSRRDMNKVFIIDDVVRSRWEVCDLTNIKKPLHITYIELKKVIEEYGLIDPIVGGGRVANNCKLYFNDLVEQWRGR